MRGGRGDRKHSAARLLSPHADALIARLGGTYDSDDPNGHFMGERFPKFYLHEANWNEIIDWMEERRKAYVTAIFDVLELDQ